MKNKTLILTKVLIKNGEGLGFKGGSTFAKISIALLFLIMVPAMMIGLGFFISSILDLLRQIGQEGVILSWGIAINSAVIFIFGVFYIISTFYFSTDVENLLHLPLKPRQIVGAKFLVVTIYEYLFTAIIFLPILIIYGVKMGSGPLHYLYGIFIFLLMPVIPLAVASIIVMIIMRFTNLAKHKDLFKVLGGMLAIFVGLGFNLVMQNMVGVMSPQQLQELLQKGENSLIGITSSIFPTAKWAAEALINSSQLSGLLSFLIFVGFSIAVFVGLLYLGELLYFKGVVGISETGSKRNHTNQQDIDKSVIKGSMVRTYTIVELKLLFRTPIYFLNCVMINFLWPIFFIFPLVVQTEGMSMLSEFTGVLNKEGFGGIILAMTFALALFLGGINAAAPTAISREGQELFVKKYIPMSYKEQLTAKIISGFILGYIGIVMMVIFAVFMFKMSILLGLLVLATAWMPILLMCFTGIMIDLYNPKLVWDNEQKAVKQNVNVLYNIVIGIALAGLTGFLAFRFSWTLLTSFIILVVIFGGLNYLMYYLMCTKGVKRFCELEG